MEKAELIEKLEAGYELADRGTGWWLSTPSKPYVRPHSLQVERELVEAMVDAGELEYKLLTVSARATLPAKKQG